MQAEDNQGHRHELFLFRRSNNYSIMATSSSDAGARRSVEPPRKSNPRILLMLLKGIIMALIVALFFLLLGIAVVAILQFIIAGGALHARRLRRSSSSSPTSTQFPSDSVTVAYSAEELHRSLTSMEYSEAETAEKECAICLDGFKIGTLIRKLPDCRHTYHSSCIGKWLMRAANCPICRRRVILNTASVGGRGLEEETNEVLFESVNMDMD